MKVFKYLSVVFLQLFALAATDAKIDPAVIIVGAGPAGIAAATKLYENGHKNVVILEAEGRIGGRVNSVHFGNAYIDLGAEWCHGKNLVYDLVKDYNILRHTEMSDRFYHSSDKNMDQVLAGELIDIMDDIYVPDGHRDEEEGQAVGHYCIHKFNATIHERYAKHPKKLKIAKSSLNYFHHYVLGNEGAFSWFEPSAKNDYRDCEGDLNLNWNGFGYKTALDALMRKFPDPTKQLRIEHAFRLNTEVIKVLWNETNEGVTVICGNNATYVGDHVIFTPSVGVLKADHEKLFNPALPDEKQLAIKDIGFGAVMKIVMRFERNWWGGRNFTGFNFLWSDDDRILAHKEFPEGPFKEDKTWLSEFFCLLPVENNPNVLIGWLTGDMIPDIERLSNETLINGVVFVMNKFLSHHYNVSAPSEVLRTSWYSNPHFRGTYSFQTIEARRHKESPEVVLSKPLFNVDGKLQVQFAGEASHPNHYSTVHGAIETGHREAQRIIDLYH